jgi:hypothetical protein
MAADRDGDDAVLLERLATAKRLIQRAVAEGDVEPGIAAGQGLPRASMITLLEQALRLGRLRVAPGCPGADLLAGELLAARHGAHAGDLLVAVGLALYAQVVRRLGLAG